MSKRKTINETKNICKDIVILKEISRKYYFGHNYYKSKLKNIKLKVRKLIKTSDVPYEINELLSKFLEEKRISSKYCDQLIEKLSILLQDLEIENENTKNFNEIIYDKNSPFKFHLDIKKIIEKTKKELFIVEPFVNEYILEITLKDVNRNIKINILTNSKTADRRGKFDKISNLFKKEFLNYEVKESEIIHDRGIFIDDTEGWVIGQSIKDAAKNKPTYLIRLKVPNKLKNIYRSIWNTSKKASQK